MTYWAIDFITPYEYELVYNDQLYSTREAAEEAAAATNHPNLFDITPYTFKELEEIYNNEIKIDNNLHISLL